tara:strand:+ start:400 stop:642 length:243 start_codon:yes stop_codon:yes gene_type:complete
MKVDITTLTKMNRYKENLLVSDDFIFSYLTNVAKINHKLKQITTDKYYSVTTSKHINYIANQYNYKVIRTYLQPNNKRGY